MARCDAEAANAHTKEAGIRCVLPEGHDGPPWYTDHQCGPDAEAKAQAALDMITDRINLDGPYTGRAAATLAFIFETLAALDHG